MPLTSLAFLNFTHLPVFRFRPPVAASGQSTFLEADASWGKAAARSRRPPTATAMRAARVRMPERGAVRGLVLIFFSYRLPAGLAVGLALHFGC